MGYAGVDLKEEAEHFLKDGDGASGILPDGIDRSKSQDFMNVDMLKDRIMKYAKTVDIQHIDNDFVNYLALAVQDRIRTVTESMVTASKLRTYNPFKEPPKNEDGSPLYKIQVKQNVKSQLEAIERVSRGTQMDEEEKEEKEGWYCKYSRRPLSIPQTDRKVTVQDAIFVMERDFQGGRGTNQKTLLKAYNEWLS
ncbi:hypothetical protein BDB01DRAFT_805587 [Pilobolus umbonatus]|nr:hypothetical protein BDB01DRAFT_805587 [Pilobolus umbonatus]